MNVIKARRVFPLGKAYGKAFCNRVNETQKLIGNIESGKHTFIVAPRRYGKSSLCERAFEKIHCASAKIDFHLVTSERDVERLLINGVIDLIGKAVGSTEKLVHVIKKYAKKLKPKFIIGNEHMKLELAIADDASPAESIAEALLLLEKLLKDRGCNAVLLLDEFQEIGLLANGKAIEGAIRHIAQETQQLSLIFCGSNPHLLQNMFEDERRPLYKLCRKIVLDRISEEHYRAHLAMAAKEIWGKPLSEDVFLEIMRLTERHPYYVNYLCDELCSECDSLPKLANVKKAWDLVIEEERSDLIKDFTTLAQNQRKIMIYIANHGGANLYAADAAKIMEIPSGSIRQGLMTLIERDYIEKAGDEYRLIVPVFNSILQIKAN